MSDFRKLNQSWQLLVCNILSFIVGIYLKIPDIKISNGFDCSNGMELSEEIYFRTNLAVPSAESDPSGTHFFTITDTSLYQSNFAINGWSKIFSLNIGSNFASSYHSIGVGSLNRIAVCIDDNSALHPSEIVFTTDGWLTLNFTNIKATFPTWSIPQSSNLYICSNYAIF